MSHNAGTRRAMARQFRSWVFLETWLHRRNGAEQWLSCGCGAAWQPMNSGCTTVGRVPWRHGVRDLCVFRSRPTTDAEFGFLSGTRVFFFWRFCFESFGFFCWRNMCSYRRNVRSSGEALGKLRGSSGKIWGSSGEIPRKFRESGETFTSQVFIFIYWSFSPSQLFTVIIFYYFIDHCHSAFLGLPDYCIINVP